MKPALLFACLLVNFVAWTQSTEFLATKYEARDFTAENLFTENIEGPCFDRFGKLFVVNFQKDGTIGYVHEDGTVELFLTLPDGSVANAIQFNSNGDMLLADYTGHNVLSIDVDTQAISELCHNSQFSQPNDICIARNDRIFASDPNWKAGTGQVWRIEKDGKYFLAVSDMGTTNGIELSPDETILYVNESVQRKVWAFDVGTNGLLTNKRLFYEFPDFGMDGMKCDNQGNLYICRWGKGTIAVVSPKKELLREVTLTGKKVSNIVFGGKDGKTCFVTLQDRKGMEMFRSEIAGKKYK